MGPPWQKAVEEGHNEGIDGAKSRFRDPHEAVMEARVGTGRVWRPPTSTEVNPAVPVLKVAGAQTYKAPPKKRQNLGRFTMAQLKETDAIIRLQSGTNLFDSQRGMTGFGTPRNTDLTVKSSNPDLIPRIPAEADLNQQVGRWTLRDIKASDAIIPSQYGSNQFASQKKMTGFGSPRDVTGKHLHRIWDDYEFAEDE